MMPRLSLNPRQKGLVVSSLIAYLNDRSSIVKVFALQGLADLAQADANIRPAVLKILGEATWSGTPAMKARTRKLLNRVEPFDGSADEATPAPLPAHRPRD